MKTSNKTLAPFSMYTITLTNDINVIILLEVNISNSKRKECDYFFLSLSGKLVQLVQVYLN